MNSERRAVLLGTCLWLAGGMGLARLDRTGGNFAAKHAGPAGLFRLAGGYSALTADWLWLEANVAWERRDAAEIRRLIHRTVSADPRAVYFWLNGARILAYDLAAWRRDAEPDAPAALRQRWRVDGADEATAFLQRGLGWHGHSAALYLELANISLYARGDRERAAAYYREAAECPDAPAYAARLARSMGEPPPEKTLTRRTR